MPRWARFLSCTLTGSLLTVFGFLLVTDWLEGGSEFWSQALNFAATPAFWGLVWLFGLLTALGLVMARVAVHVYDFRASVAGALAGVVLALVYAAFVLSAHTADWGGMSVSLRRAWPAVPAFAVPFACSGAFMAWLWDRLD